MTVWAVGGESHVSHRQRPEWTMFRQALVVRWDGDRVEPVLAWQSPPAHRPDRSPSHVFKAATVVGAEAFLCTQTEVLLCDFPSFAVREVISLPCFNDLHHVAPGPDGTLFVAVTGLDAVAEVTRSGELVRLVSVVGGSPWDRFSRDLDYRKVPTTKPHLAHPNFVFFLDGRPWVTRLEQRDVVPLDGGPGRRIHDAPIHDGQVAYGAVWFTGVDGTLIRLDPAGGLATWPLRALAADDDDAPLGWCRSVLANRQRAWVGYSRIRFTRTRRNLSWLAHGFQHTEHHRVRPTRMVLYDLEAGREVRSVDLEPAGMGAVFSLHGDGPGAWASPPETRS